MSIPRRSRATAFAACLALATISLVRLAHADDDSLTPYRDRFRLGMEKYKAGALAEAIRVWNAIYEEIGPKRGYRLSFNLARAYDTNGEATRAAERYHSFLDEVDARGRANEAVEPLVERETHDAEERLAALNREHGRIEVSAATTLAQVDNGDPRLGAFVAYVAPGKHVVTFGPGRDDAVKVDVTVAVGELVAAHGPDAPPTTTPPLTVDLLGSRELRRPFSPAVLYAGAVATAASIVVPVLAYGYANSLVTTYKSASSSVTSKTNAYNDYNGSGGAQTLAYASVAAPITLGAVTGVLTTWYFAGTREVKVSLSGAVSPRGANAALHGSF